MPSDRHVTPTTVKFYVGVRDGARITLLVPGHFDSLGEERISALDARAIEAVLDGGDYRPLPHIAEPTCSTSDAWSPAITTSTRTQTPLLFAKS